MSQNARMFISAYGVMVHECVWIPGSQMRMVSCVHSINHSKKSSKCTSHSQFDAFHKTQPAETVRQHQLQITLQQHGKTKYRKESNCLVN